jgi:hypothetical protein
MEVRGPESVCGRLASTSLSGLSSPNKSSGLNSSDIAAQLVLDSIGVYADNFGKKYV